MIIRLSPIRCDSSLTASRFADIILINGEGYDFSALPSGATIPAGNVPCDWIVGPVSRTGAGDLTLTLLLPHGMDPSNEVAFPEPIINPPDGPLDLPFDQPTTSEGSDHVDD